MDTSNAFSGFSVDDIDRAEAFYRDSLGVTTERQNGMLLLSVGSGRVLVYPKGPAHQPASYTVLNFPVDDIDAAVDELVAKGVHIERYDGMEHDERGVMRAGGPPIAWFTDPAGNVLSVLESDTTP